MVVKKHFPRFDTNARFGAYRLPDNHKRPDKSAIDTTGIHFNNNSAFCRYKARFNNGRASIGNFLPHDYSHSYAYRHANAGNPDRSQALRFRCIAADRNLA